MSGGSGDDDMPVKIDFSGGTRGKFHRPDVRLSLPVYLDPDVQADHIAIALTRSVTPSDIANDLLRKSMAKAGK
jgi:hypothetical protein